VAAPIVIRHNLAPPQFQWLWAKYVVGVNDTKHCTNCLRGPYSKRFSAHNPHMAGTELVLDETPVPWRALYLCGVAKRGYPRSNYPHNLHAAVQPEPGHRETFTFEGWEMQVENGRFLPIPSLAQLPKPYRLLPPAFTTCRIFRWAVVTGAHICA
jgi:hypothetical protein